MNEDWRKTVERAVGLILLAFLIGLVAGKFDAAVAFFRQ